MTSEEHVASMSHETPAEEAVIEPPEAPKKVAKLKKTGRPKGRKRTGGEGYYKPPSQGKWAPREARAWLMAHGGAEVVENRIRKALGRPYKTHGPTGKKRSPERRRPRCRPRPSVGLLIG